MRAVNGDGKMMTRQLKPLSMVCILGLGLYWTLGWDSAHAVRRLGCVPAVCIDGCPENEVGSRSACQGDCKYGNVDYPSSDTDGYKCNHLFLSTAGPRETIFFCSPNPGSAPIPCADGWGRSKPCSILALCICFRDLNQLEHCTVWEPSNPVQDLDTDDCNPMS